MTATKALQSTRVFYTIIIILIYFLKNHACGTESINRSGLAEPNNGKNCDNAMMSRKKRALTFPSGSTIQLGTYVDIACIICAYNRKKIQMTILTLFPDISRRHIKNSCKKLRLDFLFHFISLAFIAFFSSFHAARVN